MTEKLRPYGIIGDGKVARHFAHYFEQLHISYLCWSRTIEKKSHLSPEQTLKECPVILILIKDAAIIPFLHNHPELAKKKAVHFSGSLVTDIAFGCHPLMTFGPDLYSLSVYRTISFVVEEGPQQFHQLFPTLPNSYYSISKQQKSFYHALCVISGNFTTLLWQKCMHEFAQQLSLPPQILYPYMNQTIQNLMMNHSKVLTGPFERKDYTTIRKNLKALTNDSYQEIYRSFLRAYLPDFISGTKQPEGELDECT